LLESDEHEGVEGDEEDEGADPVEDEVEPDAVDGVVVVVQAHQRRTHAVLVNHILAVVICYHENN
jgi:hypothetical protein